MIHPRFEVISITDIHDIPKSVCKRAQSKNFISRHPIYLTDSEHYYIIEEIGRQEKIDFEIYVEF